MLHLQRVELFEGVHHGLVGELPEGPGQPDHLVGLEVAHAMEEHHGGLEAGLVDRSGLSVACGPDCQEHEKQDDSDTRRGS